MSLCVCSLWFLKSLRVKMRNENSLTTLPFCTQYIYIISISLHHVSIIFNNLTRNFSIPPNTFLIFQSVSILHLPCSIFFAPNYHMSPHQYYRTIVKKRKEYVEFVAKLTHLAALLNSPEIANGIRNSKLVSSIPIRVVICIT